MTTPTSNPDLLHLVRTGFPVLKPQVAVDLSYELKIVIPPPTTDPFDTPAWDDLQKAIDEIRHGVHVEEKQQSKKRHEREDVGAPDDESAGDSEEDEEEAEPEETVDSDGPEEEEDLRMALDTQRALDGYDRIFQVGKHQVTQLRDDQVLRFDQLYPTTYHLNAEGDVYKKLIADDNDDEEKE